MNWDFTIVMSRLSAPIHTVRTVVVAGKVTWEMEFGTVFKRATKHVCTGTAPVVRIINVNVISGGPESIAVKIANATITLLAFKGLVNVISV